MKKRIFYPLKNKRIFEEISDQIRNLIYMGLFKPGDKLPSERELANQFNVGRMVVREALRTLEQSGLIYIKYGSLGGAFIKNIDSEPLSKSFSDMIKIGNISLEELTEARLGIELMILEFVGLRLDDDDLNLIKENIEKTKKKLLDRKRPLEENLNFHLLVAKASKNKMFEIISRSIMDVTKSFLLTVRPDDNYIKRVAEYHMVIYEALKEKNFQVAKEKMKEHLLDINQKILDLKISEKKQEV